jgi:hypothetical protein
MNRSEIDIPDKLHSIIQLKKKRKTKIGVWLGHPIVKINVAQKDL